MAEWQSHNSSLLSRLNPYHNLLFYLIIFLKIFFHKTRNIVSILLFNLLLLHRPLECNSFYFIEIFRLGLFIFILLVVTFQFRIETLQILAWSVTHSVSTSCNFKSLELHLRTLLTVGDRLKVYFCIRLSYFNWTSRHTAFCLQ